MWAGGGALGGGPGVRGRHLVPGQVDSEAKARALPNSVCIRLSEIGPEAPVLIAVPGEIKDAATVSRGQRAGPSAPGLLAEA